MSRRRTASPESLSGRRETHEGWYSHFLGNHRTLTVYVPPGYDADAKQRYPVLYLHDGQNLFDPTRAAFGVAWEADATAERLILARRIPPLLLVGIDNTPDRREDEYGYHRDEEEQTGGRGPLYARFVLEEVKPFIDGRYRTRPGRRDTAVAGSSMGGLVSLSMAREIPPSSGYAAWCRRRCGGRTARRCRRSRTATRPGCAGCASGWTWARARTAPASAAMLRRRSAPRGGWWGASTRPASIRVGIICTGRSRAASTTRPPGGAVRQDVAVFLWEVAAPSRNRARSMETKRASTGHRHCRRSRNSV